MPSGDPDAGSRGEGRLGELGSQGQMGQGLDGGRDSSGATSECPSAELHRMLQHVADGCTGW